LVSVSCAHAGGLFMAGHAARVGTPAVSGGGGGGVVCRQRIVLELEGGLLRHYILSGRRRDSEKYKYLGSLTCASFGDDKSHCKDLFFIKDTVSPDIGNMLFWMVTLGKCTRENKCTHGAFHVFYFERDV
jgi:hypothetical protein